MGFLSPKPPAIVAPPAPPQAADPIAKEQATVDTAALERRKSGRRSTILTGGLGVQGQANTEVKRLLGA